MALQHTKKKVYQLSEGAVTEDLLQLHLPCCRYHLVLCYNPCWAIKLQQEFPWLSLPGLCMQMPASTSSKGSCSFA